MSNALSQIFTLIPIWTPVTDGIHSSADSERDFIQPEFPKFSVEELANQGVLLLASSGKEFVKPTGIFSSAQEVKKARKEAMDRLGLGFLDGVDDDMDLDKEFGEMDVDAEVPPPDAAPMELDIPVKEPSPSTRSVSPVASSPPAQSAATPEPDLSALSARERNRLKRKRKPGNSAFVAPPPQAPGARYTAAPAGASSKARLINPEEAAPTGSRRSSPTPTNGTGQERVIIDPSKGGAIAPKSTKQSRALEVDKGLWVWDGVVKVLEVDLFSAAWEVRHGAAMALRELLKAQGKCGGMHGTHCKCSIVPNLIFS